MAHNAPSASQESHKDIFLCGGGSVILHNASLLLKAAQCVWEGMGFPRRDGGMAYIYHLVGVVDVEF